MKLLSLILVSALAFALTACTTGVPSTIVQFDPATGALNIKSPKQVTSKNFKASVHLPSGAITTVSWDDLSSLNDSAIINAAGSADAKVIEATAGLVKQVGETAGTLAGAAAQQAVKP